jgi:hypothetical protein
LENDLVVSLILEEEDNFDILEHNGKGEEKEFYDLKVKYYS